MTTRYPIWMIIAFGLQLLLFLTAGVYAVVMSSAFSGIVPAKAWLSLMPFSFTVICCGLSIWQWRKNRPRASRLLVLAPIIVTVLVFVLVSIFFPASPPQM